MIRSIKTTLFTTPKMRLYASVSLLDSKSQEPTWYSMYRGNYGSFLTFTPTASLTMKYLKEKLPGDDDWSRQEQIYLTHKNFGGFKLDLQQFYKRFQRPDLFAYDDNNIPISVNKGNRDIVACSFESGQVCTFEPAIVLNYDKKLLPGVILRINMKKYEVPMTVGEFESFYDIIQNVQLYAIGMNMIQLYLAMNHGMEQPAQKVKTNSAAILFEQTEEKKEEDITTSNPLYKSPTTLDELGGLI